MSISVVIPLYNKAPYICRAVSSVLRQSFQDFECIVVDDGSTDGGGDVVEKMGDPRIRLVRQANGGVSRARNKGINVARNRLIAFLDADDEWLPAFLEDSLEMHREHPQIAASFTNYRREPEGKPVFPGTQPGSRVLADYFAFCLCHHGCGMCSSTVIARRDILLRIGGFPVGRPMGEDLDTWFRLACAGPIAYTTNPLAIYHHTGGVTTTMEINSDVWPTYCSYAQSNRVPKPLVPQAEQWAAFTRIYTVKSKLRRRKRLLPEDLLPPLPQRLLLNSANIEVLIAMVMPMRLRHLPIFAGDILAAIGRSLSLLTTSFH